MNKRQKEILQAQLDNEKAVLKKLEGNYKDALDEINSKIELLMARQDADMQHVIYQVEYQKALRTQVQSILENLQTNEFGTIAEYLTKSYEDGFIGTMYDLQGQGIPLIFPLDQKAVVDAIQNETELSEKLYTRLGRDITDLKKKITGEISRGLSSGQMYSEISRNIASWAQIPKNNAMRITRTEAHRIQCKATADAQHRAKEKGADVVKQWDATLDSKTRKSHRKLDGQIRELEEEFEVNGHKAMMPGGFGRPEEDINCRCALLQRARWALGNDYTKWSEDAPIVYSDDGTAQLAIIEAKNYKDFQEQYKQASEQVRSGVQKTNPSLSERNKSDTKQDVQNASSLEEINQIASEKLGMKVDFSKGTIEYAKEQVGYYEKLATEYNQSMQVVQLGTSGMFGKNAAAEAFISPDYKYATISLSGKNAKPTKLDRLTSYAIKVDDENVKFADLAHEFAHTITASKGGNEEFWKEIKSIKNRYNRALTAIDKANIVDKTLSTADAIAKKNEIFISKYANESVDEFMAEAFSDAKLSTNPSEYSVRVLEVIDKYFGKK